MAYPWRLYRIQDADGRGPFKPGLSRFWADENFADGMISRPSILEDFGPEILRQMTAKYHWGTGVRSLPWLDKWFSRAEQEKLAALGYSRVSMRPDVVLGISEHQILFGTERPFKDIARDECWHNLPQASKASGTP